MALCPAKKKNGQPCHQVVYRCTNCGAVGCDNRDCGNQKFASGGQCMSCGKLGGNKKPV